MKLVKYSVPGWEKEFAGEYELVAELRKHICGTCLRGGPEEYLDENGKVMFIEHEPVLDVEYDGKVFECRDIGALLGTACGCEFGVEE